MAEQTQIQVTTKDPKKVASGKRLAEWNCRKRVEDIQLAKAQSESKITYYGSGAVVEIGVLDVIGYYVYHPRLLRRQQLTDPMKLQPINLTWIRL